MEPNYRSSEEIAAAEDGYVIREDNADYFALVPASGREDNRTSPKIRTNAKRKYGCDRRWRRPLCVTI